MQRKTIEEKAAEVLLQKPLSVTIGGKEYQVAKPTLATLAEVSSILSQIRKVENSKEQNIVQEVLARAKDDVPKLALIAATLIIGGGNITYHTERREIGRIFGIFKRYEKVTVNNAQTLAEELARTASPAEMHVLVTKALSYQGVGFFLSTIISLGAASVTAPTKSVTEATALGD